MRGVTRQQQGSVSDGGVDRMFLHRFLGPSPTKVDQAVEYLERVDCGRYVREKIRYSVGPDEFVSAFVCVPHNLTGRAPAVFCHHQHGSRFDLGKSEVVGLTGDPDQAYAHELAERGFVTIAPDAIGFEERNWSSDGASNISWFELPPGWFADAPCSRRACTTSP